MSTCESGSTPFAVNIPPFAPAEEIDRLAGFDVIVTRADPAVPVVRYEEA